MEVQAIENRAYAEGYLIYRELGHGAQAEVYLGSKQFCLYALKVFHSGASNQDAYEKEVQVYQTLNHEHILAMISHKRNAVITLFNAPPIMRPLLVLEYGDSDLFQFLQSAGKFIPQVCRTYAKQLLSVVKYLSDHHFTHRDLKPANILLSKTFKIKIADFGLSKGCLGQSLLKSSVGTYGYRTPQMESGHPYTGLEADMFAVGVIIFIMFKGSPPFLRATSTDAMYKLIKNGKQDQFWTQHSSSKPQKFFPETFKNLMNSFFSFDVKNRPTFASLMDDEWLNGQTFTETLTCEYMKERQAEMAVTHPIISQVANLRREFEIALDEAENLFIEAQQSINQHHLSEEDMTNRGVSSLFVQNYLSYQINLKALPAYSHTKVVYIKKRPQFVLAWIDAFLNYALKNENIFIEKDLYEITPLSYVSTFKNETSEVNLRFNYLINEQEEVQMSVTGKLHINQNNEVGIEWIPSKGDDFWLSSIIGKLNENLRALNPTS